MNDLKTLVFGRAEPAMRGGGSFAATPSIGFVIGPDQDQDQVGNR
jgi:hypothetical protein